MANLCTNILWISGVKDEKQMQQFMDGMNKTFECFYQDDGDIFCEIGFSSRYGFPETEMKELAEKIDVPALQIGIISYDFSLNYVAYHLYKQGIWSKAF